MKCKHPNDYRQAVNVPPPPKGKYVYWCSKCKIKYTVVEKIVKLRE